MEMGHCTENQIAFALQQTELDTPASEACQNLGIAEQMADLKVFAKTVEPEVIGQVNLLLVQPVFKDCKAKIMPDTYSGKEWVIGFTTNLGDEVIPNFDGVDIGCGMLTICLGDKANVEKWLDLQKLGQIIRERVPFGMNTHEHEVYYGETGNLKCLKAIKKH